jgi:predicted nucleic acid-binding protein
MLAYFDSSVLLAIILDEKRKAEAVAYWQKADLRFSSLLLKIETLVVLRRLFTQHKKKLGNVWLTVKTNALNKYLEEVNYKPVDEKIEKEIFLRKDLARCRALDAIHLATALNFREISGSSPFYFYTFDQTMHKLAEHYKFKTNNLR